MFVFPEQETVNEQVEACFEACLRTYLPIPTVVGAFIWISPLIESTLSPPVFDDMLLFLLQLL